MWSLLFLISCFVFSSIIFIVYKSKQHIKSIDNEIFSNISLMTSITTLTEILLQILTNWNITSPLTNIFGKIYLIMTSIWFAIFSVYVFYILKIKSDNVKNIKLIHNIVSIILGIVYLILPIIIVHENNIMYSYGPGVNLLKIVIGIYLGLWLLMSIIKNKLVYKKNYIPIVGIFILMIANLILQSFNPGITIVSFTLTVVVYLMYFTIENPDVKMVNELYKNNNIMEQTYIDKSNFLFEMTQEVRNPIFNIKRECQNLNDSKNVKDFQVAIAKIKKYAEELDYIVDDVLNVNSLDATQIKFIDNKYNLNFMISEVIKQVKNAINEKVSFTYDIDKNIPDLYGDSIKIKQIVSSLLLNSARRTDEGFIDFRIDTIKRFDAIRLIINIKDSSKGIPIEVVNDILNTTLSLDKKELECLEKNEIDMELCQKIIKLMNGNLLIKSNKSGGNNITLTIDQKIDTTKNISNKYDSYIDKEAHVAIVNQDKKRNEYLKKCFNINDIKTTIYLNGINLIDDIKSGKKYNYIIVSNNMKSINGYTIFQKLKELKDFNTPMMIMIENESLKKHLLEDGFKEVILTSSLQDDLNKIIEKY